MKKILFLFVLGFSCLGFSQEKKDVSKLTTGKWQIESMEIGNEKLELLGDGHYMIFHNDGVYQIALDNKEQSGNWKLLASREIEFDSENFAGSTHIKKLTDTEFLFSIHQGSNVCTMTLKR